MSRIKVRPYGRKHRIAKVFLFFLDDLENHPHVQQVGNGPFIQRGSYGHLGYKIKSYHPDKHSIQVIARCRKGRQKFFVRVKPYEPRVISEVTEFIESYQL